MDPLPESYVKNCFLSARGDEALFQVATRDGEPVHLATLDGYAIIPIEKYRQLAGEDS